MTIFVCQQPHYCYPFSLLVWVLLVNAAPPARFQIPALCKPGARGRRSSTLLCPETQLWARAAMVSQTGKSCWKCVTKTHQSISTRLYLLCVHSTLSYISIINVFLLVLLIFQDSILTTIMLYITIKRSTQQQSAQECCIIWQTFSNYTKTSLLTPYSKPLTNACPTFTIT